MLTIRGKIRFAKGNPSSIPDGSTLTVKFQDTNLADAAAITLGTSVQTITGYNGGDLTFEIKDAEKPKTIPEASMSAVLNMGWAASGDEWIRKGDYLNDTHHPVVIVDGKNEYEQDVEVIHYT